MVKQLVEEGKDALREYYEGKARRFNSVEEAIQYLRSEEE